MNIGEAILYKYPDADPTKDFIIQKMAMVPPLTLHDGISGPLSLQKRIYKLGGMN